VTWRPMRPEPISATATAAGSAVADYSPVVPTSIEQISVSTTGSSGTALVYLDNLFVLGSSQGWLDSADGPPPIDVNPGSHLQVRWTGAGAAVGCTALLMGQQDV